MSRSIPLAALASFLLLPACKSLRNEQLESIAKDWSFVVRASQVMPVYPLTEDLFPGDVFLVQSPIDQQQRTWKEKGYLPLDNHLARLVPDGYEAFYANSFELKRDGNPPKLWLTPTSSSTAWSAAPRAAFPTYSIEAKSGYGLSGALPIQGIPVGLSLLGARSAYATVTLADARTYGTEITSLHPQVQSWAHDHREFLAGFAPRGGHVNYLRVVNRVYLVGRVAVSIENNESQGAGLKAGVPPPVELLIPQRSTIAKEADARAADEPGAEPGAQPAAQPSVDRRAAAAYEANLQGLNTSLDATYANANTLQAGATFKFTAASARSVSLSETFPRPLVIGYLGFDVAIGEDGQLGPPIPTYSVVTYGLSPSIGFGSDARLIANSRMQTATRALKEMAEGGDARAKDLVQQLDALGALVPPLLPCTLYDSNGKIEQPSGTPLRKDPPRFEQVSKFRGGLIRTIENLEQGKKTTGFQLEDQPADQPASEFLEAHLAMCRSELAWLEERLQPHASLMAEADRYTAPYQPK